MTDFQVAFKDSHVFNFHSKYNVVIAEYAILVIPK